MTDLQRQLAAAVVGVEQPEPETQDAGSSYRERLAIKQKALRLWRWIKITLTLGVLIAIAGLSYAGYEAYKTRHTQVVTDMRPCKVEVGDVTITGTREYQYNYLDIFGFRIIDTGKIDVATAINYTGGDMTVVGLGGPDGWWSAKTSDGEFGKLKIKPAEQYTFIVKGRVNVVTSDKLCK